MIKKPIFIIGVPRSGTTFLYEILASHPDICYFTSNDLQEIIPVFKHDEIISKWKKLKFEIGKVPQNEENFFASLAYRKSLGEFIPKPVAIEGEAFWIEFFGSDFIEDISLNKKSELIKKLQNLIDKNQKPRFLNKAPQNCMRLFALKKCFPDAKFIHIFRDPRSVISSSIKRNDNEGIFDPGISISNLEEIQQKPEVEKWSWFYKKIMDYIYDFSSKQLSENFHSVKYETLLSKPHCIVPELLNFCELRPIIPVSKLIPQIKDTTEKWKEKLNSNDIETISAVTFPILNQMNISYNF